MESKTYKVKFLFFIKKFIHANNAQKKQNCDAFAAKRSLQWKKTPPPKTTLAQTGMQK